MYVGCREVLGFRQIRKDRGYKICFVAYSAGAPRHTEKQMRGMAMNWLDGEKAGKWERARGRVLAHNQRIELKTTAVNGSSLS